MGLHFWNSPTLTTWGSLATRLLGLSVLLPLALNKFSTAEASLWLLFSTIIGLLALADFGFAPTFMRAIAYAKAAPQSGEGHIKNNTTIPPDAGIKSLSKITGTMSRIYNRMGLAALVIGGIGGTLAIAEPIAHISNQWVGWTAWFAVLISTCINFRLGIYAAYLQGTERIANFRRWEIFSGILTIVISISVILAGGGLLGLVLSTQVGMLTTSLINHRLATSSPVDKIIWHTSNAWNNEVWQSTWPPALRSGLGILMTIGTIQGSAIIYAQFASPAEVAAYLLAIRLMQTLVNLANAPFYTKLPVLARLYAEGRKTELVHSARIGMLQANSVLLSGTIFLGIFAEYILKLIGSQTNFISTQVWWILALSTVLERIGAMHLQLYTITNHVVWHIANGIAGLIMLIAIPMFYSAYGVIGLPMGALAGFGGFYLPYSVIKSYKAFQIRPSRLDLTANILPVFCLLIAFFYSFE